MNPYVKSLRVQDDYRLLLTFENGEKRIFDLEPFLNKGVFTRLKNVALFKTARVVAGSVEWMGEIDLSYDTLYLSSIPVKIGQATSKLARRSKMKVATLPAKRTRQAKASLGAK